MKVFVLCPAATATGGPEALHQLAHAGRTLGFEVHVVYLPEGHPDPMPAVYRPYGVLSAPRVVDAPSSVVVVPESHATQLLRFRHARRVLWWLSVDHFVVNAEMIHRRMGAAGAARPMDFVFDPRQGVHHWAQSEYARAFLAPRGVAAPLVTDHVRDEIVDDAERLRGRLPREDLVVFNPKKGIEFTRTLMNMAPQLQWLPLQNMTPAQVAEAMARAKVYVDFGNHPGRDRIPREAALGGAVVITGTRGSAGNVVDVPLPPRFKVDERGPLAAADALAAIDAALHGFDAASAAQDGYRAWIRGQKAVFLDQVFAVLAGLEAQIHPVHHAAA